VSPRELKVGEIVQIDPASDDRFGGCLMVVSEPKSWGAQGYVQNAGSNAQAYYRCPFENMEPTGGIAPWVIGSAAGEAA
jgi:hypothetical protein